MEIIVLPTAVGVFECALPRGWDALGIWAGVGTAREHSHPQKHSHRGAKRTLPAVTGQEVAVRCPPGQWSVPGALGMWSSAVIVSPGAALPWGVNWSPRRCKLQMRRFFFLCVTLACSGSCLQFPALVSLQLLTHLTSFCTNSQSSVLQWSGIYLIYG